MVYWWETLCTEGWLVMADRESGLLSLQNITNWWFWSDFWSPAENQMGKEKAILPMFVSLWCLTFVTKTNKKRGGRDSTKRLLLARWVSELQFWHVCNRIQSHPSEWLQMPGVWALWCFFFSYDKFFSLEKPFAPLGQNIVVSIPKAPLKFLR